MSDPRPMLAARAWHLPSGHAKNIKKREKITRFTGWINRFLWPSSIAILLCQGGMHIWIICRNAGKWVYVYLRNFGPHSFSDLSAEVLPPGNQATWPWKPNIWRRRSRPPKKMEMWRVFPQMGGPKKPLVYVGFNTAVNNRSAQQKLGCNICFNTKVI